MRITVEKGYQDDIFVLKVHPIKCWVDVKLPENIKEILTNGPRNIVIDLSTVGWVDAAGLGQIVTIWSKAKKGGGEARIVALGKVRKVMTLIAIPFPFYSTADEAVASFGTNPPTGKSG